MILNVFCIIGLAAVSIYGFANAYPQVSQFKSDQIDQGCIGCICKAMLCNTSMTCVGHVCGPYRIMHAYWVDAGKPMLPGDISNNKRAYENCANNWKCAEQTIKNYLTRFSQDCNGDGKINCQDYVSIHVLGGFGCTSKLYPNVQKSYDQCQKELMPVKEIVNRPVEENVNRPDEEGDDDIKPYVLLQVPKKLNEDQNLDSISV